MTVRTDSDGMSAGDFRIRTDAHGKNRVRFISARICFQRYCFGIPSDGNPRIIFVGRSRCCLVFPMLSLFTLCDGLRILSDRNTARLRSFWIPTDFIISAHRLRTDRDTVIGFGMCLMTDRNGAFRAFII